MENSKIFKKLVIVMLSLVLVAVCSTSVFAADGDDLFLSVNSTGNTSTNATDNNTTANNNTTNNTTNSNTNSNSSLAANNTTNNTTRNTTNNTTNNTTSNTNRNVTNTLAKTGLSNTGSIIALVVVVCGISAVYSFKKVNDYKKL